MNLNVNLLHDEERRSAAVVSGKAIVLALAVLVVGVLLMPVVRKFFELHEIQRQHSQTDNTRREIERRASEERRRDGLLNNLLDYDSEFTFWRDADPEWSRLLMEVAAVTPANIQITRLTLQDSVVPLGRDLARQQLLTLHCLVAGAEPEPILREFHRQLVRLLGADDGPIEDFRPTNPDRTEHSFRIVCRFISPEPNA